MRSLTATIHSRIDEYLPYALNHIQADEKNLRFRYIQDQH